MKKIPAAIAGAALLVVLTTGCSSFTEPYNDAPVKVKDDSAAEIYSMPDGFANVASKCDRHGNRIYSTRTDGGEAMAVVANDPSCEKR